MAETYFGGQDGLSPIAPPSTSEYSAVNPPEYQKAAWEWENARREAEQRREMEASLGRQVVRGNVSQWEADPGLIEAADQSRKSIEAATRFQGIRGYQQDSLTMGAAKAAQKWGPLMFAGSSGGPRAVSSLIGKERVPATMQTLPGGVTQITQPSGSIQLVNPPRAAAAAEDPTEKALRDQIGKAQTILSASERKSVVARASGSQRRDALEAVTQANAEQRESKRQLQATEASLQNYLSQKTNPATSLGVQPTARTNAPVVAPTAPIAATAQAAKPLTREAAAAFLKQANNNPAEARRLAREAGYQF